MKISKTARANCKLKNGNPARTYTQTAWKLVRKLLDLAIYICFEKANLNTGSMESERMVSILCSLIKNELASISENEKWSIKKRFQNRTFIIFYPSYGYANVDGEMIIIPG